jgi:hypothetical protein
VPLVVVPNFARDVYDLASLAAMRASSSREHSRA